MTRKHSASDTREQCAAILDQLSDYLHYHQEEGATRAEVDPELVQELGAAVIPRQHDRVIRQAPPTELMPEAMASLDAIAKRIAACQNCPLHKNRTKTVPGQGCPQPEIMFVGEGPGYDEDRQGLAFVGRAGQLLTKIIEAMGFTRDQVFIGNIVKCRPPENRTPLPDEMAACLPYLKEQIALLKPKIIIALGATAVKGLLEIETGITKLRGRWMEYEGIPLMPTYHPAYLLRNPAGKRDVWEDMKTVLARIGREPSPRKT